MNFAFLCLAACGAVLYIVGRRMIIREARTVAIGWVLAVRYLPLADMMFLARYWEQGKSGAMVALTGMVLAAPYGVKTLYESRAKSHPRQVANFAGDSIDRASQERLGPVSRLQLIETKQAKIEALEGRMLEWYQSLQSRRAALSAEAPELVARFNDEAAAYQSLLSVKKEESAELANLKSETE